MVVDSGVELESAGAPDALVMADPDAMNQVFGNLIENAVKYGKSGKRIRSRCAQLAGTRLSSSCGILVRASLQSISSASSSGSIAWTRRARAKSGGTGLGLAIVKHIVQAHGGRIWAESELGLGRRHFYLPCRWFPAQTDGRTNQTRRPGNMLEATA